MKLFTVEYFDRLDWEYKEKKIIANNKEELITFINNYINPEFRYLENLLTNETRDSFLIDYEEDITIPFILE